MLLKHTKIGPSLNPTGWNDVSRDLLRCIIQKVSYKDVRCMEITCRRWREIIVKDRDFDASYWKQVTMVCVNSYTDAPNFINYKETPDIVEWYRHYRCPSWRNLAIIVFTRNFTNGYYSMYTEWLMWRYQNSLTDKKFDLYFDVFVVTSCIDCEYHNRQCHVYKKLKLQRLNLSPSKCAQNCNDLNLVFTPPKGVDVYGFGIEKDSNGNYHTTKYELRIVHRYNGKVDQFTLSNVHIRVRRSLLSRRQRQFCGELFFDNSEVFMQPAQFNSALGHSNSRSSSYYQRQSRYEARVHSDSIIDLKNVNISDIIEAECKVSVHALHAKLHEDYLGVIIW